MFLLRERERGVKKLQQQYINQWESRMTQSTQWKFFSVIPKLQRETKTNEVKRRQTWTLHWFRVSGVKMPSALRTYFFTLSISLDSYFNCQFVPRSTLRLRVYVDFTHSGLLQARCRLRRKYHHDCFWTLC